MTAYAGNLTGIFGVGGFVAATYENIAAPVFGPAEADFADVMRAAGYQVETVHFTGDDIERCRDPDDKPSGDAGWYWLRHSMTGATDRAVGCYGSWRLGGYTVWVQGAVNGDNRLTHEEQVALQRSLDAARKAREARAAESHQAAAQHAVEMIAACRPATPEHPYLAAKRVQPHGIHQLDQTLIIPRMTLDGELCSYQSIRADGTKRYQKGGRTKGTCFALGVLQAATCIAITEGYATGATVHEATGWAVLVAFDAGNLEAVAVATREAYPDARIVICGDNDHETAGNPGHTAAEEAASACAGRASVPADMLAGESDWNDLAARVGLVAVARQIAEQPAPAALATWRLDESLSNAPEPLRWAVDEWLVRGYLNLVAADGGTGKTTVFQQLAACIATGQPWFGQSVEPGPVLLVLCEDDRAAILRRQQALDRYLDLSCDGYVYPVHVLSRLAESNFLAARESKTGQWRVTDFFTQLLETCRKMKPIAVVLDSLSDVYPGSEIDRSEVSNFVSLTFARLAAECDTALVVLAHTPKAPANGKAATYSGSTAWNNKARVRLSLAPEEGSTDRLSLKVEKSNYGPTGATLHLRRFAGVIMAADEHPEAAFTRDEPAYAQSEEGRCEDAFLALMRVADERGERVSPKMMANNYGPRMFMRHYQHSAGYAFTRRQYADAMDRLLAAGQLELADVTHDRKTSRVIRIALTAVPWKA